MPKAPAPAAADALMPTIQSAPTPMLAEEDGVVNGGVDDGSGVDESPAVLRLRTIIKYRYIYRYVGTGIYLMYCWL